MVGLRAELMDRTRQSDRCSSHVVDTARRERSRIAWIISLDQWYSTWGTRRHFRGYVKFKKKENIIS
jgi:hypothetical protein